MRIQPVEGTGVERTKGWFVGWHQQWTSLIGRYNWHDFTFVHLEAEWERFTGRFETTVALLGFWLTITYVYDDSFNREMQRRADDITSGRVKAVPFDEAMQTLSDETRSTELL